MSQGYLEFIEALNRIADDGDELADVRRKTRGHSERMSQLETGIYIVFWNYILERVNATSKMLQDSQLDINSTAAAVKSLKIIVESKRDCFNEYEKQGIDKSGTADYIKRREHRCNARL